LQNAKLDDGYAFGDQRWKIEYMPLNSWMQILIFEYMDDGS
jgi:hypothetical protein